MDHRAPARSFTDLEIWQRGHQAVLKVYKLTANFPKEERYGLTSQFRRAAISIPANIAEGFRKRSRVDKARFLNTSEGSLEECRYYCLLTHDLGYGNTDDLQGDLEVLSRLLASYISRLREPEPPSNS